MAESPAVVERIRKLLALAADTSTTPHEAASAAARAQALLYKHKLELADIAALDPASGIEEIDRPFIAETWRQMLAAVTAKVNFCRVLAWPGGFKFIGHADDLQVVLALYVFLSRTIARLAREGWAVHVAELTDPALGRYPTLDEPGAEAAWKDSFKLGAVEVVGMRMERQRAAQDQSAAFDARAVVGPTKGALVLRVSAIQRWDGALGQYIADRYGPVESMDSPDLAVRLDGFARGVLAGKRLPIGPDRRRLP